MPLPFFFNLETRSMDNHSPGPWSRCDENQWVIRDNDQSVVCRIVPWDSSGCREEDHDDADLIALAPELLEALQAVMFYGRVKAPEWVIEKAREALRKTIKLSK